jgi:hypothetical protein
VIAGNLELLQVVASWTVTLPAVAAIVGPDERRLTGEALARAWPAQSRDAAIFGLWLLGVHPLAVFIHSAKTRRSLAGLALGLRYLLAVTLLDNCAQIGATLAVDWLGL